MRSHFIPESMQNKKSWCVWKLETHDGRKTKVPYCVNDHRRASCTNSETWSNYKDAVNAVAMSQDFKGLGFVITAESNLIFIDIDHCIDSEGRLDERATDILTACSDTYAEVSQSGQGIHLFLSGAIPRSFKNSKLGVEMYSDKRYCCITGDCLRACEPRLDQDAVNYVFNKYHTPEAIKTNNIVNVIPEDFSEDAVLSRALKNNKFMLLYRGQWEDAGYSSRSEADIALCMKLAFWTDRNSEAIDQLFRSSGLYRDKWERTDYREKTIQKACGLLSESVSEWKRSKLNDFTECILQIW